MTDGAIVQKLMEMGSVGIILGVLLYMTNKWAPLFLKASQEQTVAMATQATAITSLAAAVNASQSDQREILIAVRVLADRIEAQKGYLEGIEAGLRKEGVRVG